MHLSFKILAYNFFLTAFITLILKPANKIKYGITPDQATDANTFQTDFDAVFELYVAPSSYSLPVVNDMNAIYLNSFRFTESIRNQIKSNTTITLSGLERLILNIPVPAPRRTHVPVPNLEPAVVCIFKTELMMRFIAFDPTNPFRRAKPKDVAAIGVKTAIVPAGAPAPNSRDYVIQTPENLTEFEMLFTSDQVGKTLYIKCYYLNNRNEAGKDGLPCVVTII